MNHKVREVDGKKRWSVAVDFDGVLHSYTSPWEAEDVIADPPVDGAIAWLNDITTDFDVIVFTTRGRTAQGAVAVMAWLRHEGYEGPDLTVTALKPPALIYIDDRAWRFEGQFPDANEIHLARPWNKRFA